MGLGIGIGGFTRKIVGNAAGAAAPVNTTLPVVSPTSVNVGDTVSSTTGQWTGVPPPAFTYQWQSDVAGNGTFSNIGGATSSTYVAVSGDETDRLRCVVTGTNGTGSASANSLPTNAVVLVVDTTPDQFTFTDLTVQEFETVVTSNTITVAGIDAASAISITGGEYQIGAGSWVSTAGTVTNGQTVKVRHTTSANNETTISTTLTIGGVSDTFSSTTKNIRPDVFLLTDQNPVAKSTVLTSNTITITGIDAASDISITGGEYQIGAGAWTSSSGTVTNGQTVKVRHTSSGTDLTAVNTVLTIGGISDTFTTTTGNSVPNTFAFTDQFNVLTNTVYSSNTITPTGHTIATPISISGGEYRINAGSWVSTSGTLSPGQNVQVRVTSSGSEGVAATATLTIGTVSDTFSVTTAITGGAAATRYIRPSAAGSADGSSWANAAAFSALNTMISQAGPGGTVYVRADEGVYTSVAGITLNSGGSAGDPVKILGVDVNLAPMKAQIAGVRTHPWPTSEIGALRGSTSGCITLQAGANYLNFQSFHFYAHRFIFLVGAQNTGITFGNPAYRDTAVAALLPADYVFSNVGSASYLSLIDQINTTAQIGVSSDIQTYAVDFTNCYRGLDTGDPSSFSTPDTLIDFAVYGGVFQGVAEGFFRLRGAGNNHWYQDMTMDGGGLEYWGDDGDFAVGIEMNGMNTSVPGDGITEACFLRVTATRHRSTSRSGYTNGDGMSGERENVNHIYIRCVASDNEDGGIETKATNVHVIGCTMEGNRRNLRLWGSGEAHHVNLRYPTSGDGRGSEPCQLYVRNNNGWVRIWSGTLIDNNTSAFSSTFMSESTIRAYIGYSSLVSLTKDPAQALSRNYNNDYDELVQAFDINNRTAANISSISNPTVASGVAYTHTCAANVPCFFINNGGADTAQFTREQPISIGARDENAPTDLNGDSVYVFTLRAETVQGTFTNQTVSLTVGTGGGGGDPPPAATNLILKSEAFDNAAWTKFSMDVTANSVANPLDGDVDAETLIATAVNASHGIDATPITTGGTATPHTYSIYAKSAGLLGIQMRTNAALGTNYANFDLVNGVNGNKSTGASNQTITALSNGWYRCSYTFTPNTNATGTFTITLIQSATSARAVSFLGNGTDGVYVYGAMAQTGSILSAYVPNL